MIFYYRFDYKHRHLPYYLYMSFKTMPSSRTLSWISKKIDSYNFVEILPAELRSALRVGIRIMSYSDFKKLCKNIPIPPPPSQPVLHFPERVPF